MTINRKDYKLRRGENRSHWTWGNKARTKLDISLSSDETLEIKSLPGVRLSSEEVDYFCEQLLRSGARVFPQAKDIRAMVNRKRVGAYEEKGHIGDVAINKHGDLVSMRKAELLETSGDFTLGLQDHCPDILIVRGNLSINGQNNGLNSGIVNLCQKDISCEGSIIIADQDTYLPDKASLSYDSLGMERCYVFLPGGLHPDINDLNIEDAVLISPPGQQEKLHVMGVARLVKARFKSTGAGQDLLSPNMATATGFPFKRLQADAALILRQPGIDIVDTLKITTRKFYPDRKKGCNYCYEGVHDKTINQILAQEPLPKIKTPNPRAHRSTGPSPE